MCNLVSEEKGPLERIPAKVQIAVFRPEFLASVTDILDGERRCHRLVEHLDSAHGNLNVSRRQFRILALALDDLSCNLENPFTADRPGSLQQFGRSRCVYDKLGDAVTVTQINEGHSSEFPGFLHPAGKGHFLPGIFEAELSASMSSVHILQIKPTKLINFRKSKKEVEVVQIVSYSGTLIFVSLCALRRKSEKSANLKSEQ